MNDGSKKKKSTQSKTLLRSLILKSCQEVLHYHLCLKEPLPDMMEYKHFKRTKKERKKSHQYFYFLMSVFLITNFAVKY